MVDPDSLATGSSPAESVNPDLGPVRTVGQEAPRGLQILEVQPQRLPYSSPLSRAAGVAFVEPLAFNLGDGQFSSVEDE